MMTENIKNIDVIDSINQCKDNVAKPKKHKHNSKRRKPKKPNSVTKPTIPSNFDNVIKFLCNVLTECDTTVKDRLPTKPKKKVIKKTENSCDTITPATLISELDLCDLFKGLSCARKLESSTGVQISQNCEQKQPSKTKKTVAKKNALKKVNSKSEISKTNSETSNQKKEKLKNCITKTVTKKNAPKKVNYKSEISKTNLETSNQKKEKLKNNVSNQPCQGPQNKTPLYSEPHSHDSQKNMDLMDLLPELQALVYSNKPVIKTEKKMRFYSSIKTLPSSPSSTSGVKTSNQTITVMNESFLQEKSKNHTKTKRDLNSIAESIDDSSKNHDSSQISNSESLHVKKLPESSASSNTTGKPKKKHPPSRKSKQDNAFPTHLSPEQLNIMNTYGVLMTGIIRINPKNYREAYVPAPDKGMDILIDGLKDRNRALEGDEVYILLKPKEHPRSNSDSTDPQRTAVVVGLKTLNHTRGAIGTLNPLKNPNDSFVLFSPRDTRLPRIRIRQSHWPKGFAEDSQSYNDKLFFVRISEWNDLRFAEGELVEEVGLIGDIEAETRAILLTHDLDVSPYSKALKKCISPSVFKMTEEDLVSREDFRPDCVFTIDPATAVDLDDAVSCKRLANGNYQVGVHISDVTHYLKEGTPLDAAISKRATTVYLVQRAYHMLPNELCRLCSLMPGEDKLSFSVIWEVSPDLEIVDHRFARTIINSCGQFSYDQVQSILEGSKTSEFPKLYGNHDRSQIEEIVLFLHKMADGLRRKRFENGALRIDQRKIRFTLDQLLLLPVEFTVETHEESHRLIEELMLLANMTVAEELSSKCPKIAFLRSHSPPVPYMLRTLKKNLEKYDIHLDISSAGSINASLMKYEGDETQLVARTLVLNNLLAKPMTRANYYCSGLFKNEEDRHHYALNVPLYTHFTSPIRRYADIMVHRLLGSLVSKSSPPNWTTEHVESIANNCNKQKYAAKMAGEASMKLYLAVYISLKGSVELEAVVCDVKDRSFDCIVLETGTPHRVFFERIKAEVTPKNEDGVLSLTVKWPIDSVHTQETVQVIKMFSIVRVELKRGNSLKVEANLLRDEKKEE